MGFRLPRHQQSTLFFFLIKQGMYRAVTAAVVAGL
jgi:hypothetical protein